MRSLCDKGNTVLIVEHKPDMIAMADHVVDMGPLAGSKGGEVVFQGATRGSSRRARSPGSTWRGASPSRRRSGGPRARP
jgi:excinuclease UvrABC ATPase subunit